MTELRLTAGSRAALLLARLDAGYLRFAAQLPPGLREIALQASTFTGGSGSEPFAGPSSMNPGVTCTPWLFWELTEPLADDLFLELALGGTLVVLASVLLDHLVDGQAVDPGRTALLQQALHQAGVARLRTCLAADPGFWPAFDRLADEHLAGLAAERAAQRAPELLALDGFLAMVPVKFSPIAATMAAFAHALGQPELLAPIEVSIKHLAIGSQLLDDMGDWEEDLADGHLTYYLTRLAPAEAWRAHPWPEATALQARIDAEWLDLECMAMAQGWLERSRAAVEELPCAAWKSYVSGYRALAEEHRDGYKACHFLRAIQPLLAATRCAPMA